MIADLLTRQFEFVHSTLKRNLADLSHEDSTAPPPTGGNSLNWVLGHMLKTRDLVLGFLGQEPPKDGRNDVYARGSGPLSPERARPLDELRREFDGTQERVLAGLADLSDEAFARPVQGIFQARSTLGAELAALAFHEAYHAGQIGLLRRAAGKPGAIP